VDTQTYISDFLTSVANIPGRSTPRASSCGNLVVPRTRRRIGDRALSVAAPRALNRPPAELKLLRSTDLFGRALKTLLFYSVRAPRYVLTLWCALNLLEGGAIQAPQLQLQLQLPKGSRERGNPVIAYLETW